VTIEVLEPGLLSTVQDPVGRRGWRHLGVPVGGAADPWSARLANRLVGNPDGAAVIEATLDGPALRLAAPALVAVTGGLQASVDGLPLAPSAARAVRPGAVVRLGPGAGARGYLAVAGGIDVEPLLGSRSTDVRSGFGGHHGRPLRGGDRLSVGRGTGAPLRWTGGLPGTGPLRVVAGPHASGRLEGLVARAWTVSAEADRTGVRMEQPLEGGGEAGSMGLPAGAIQLPPDGRPIVMLADRPVTGGYLVPAVVIDADVGRVAQLRPADGARFATVSPDEARGAWRQAETELAALEPLHERRDDELGWTGSHR
jgi:biotin-dependent carboxylase-like uncharacterized protein